ncbi:unknown [Bacteroides thetaiotaomicron CAG:40]|nr:unknown [Bacteroides thetaiotaomicron CAG:40]
MKFLFIINGRLIVSNQQDVFQTEPLFTLNEGSVCPK